MECPLERCKYASRGLIKRLLEESKKDTVRTVGVATKKVGNMRLFCGHGLNRKGREADIGKYFQGGGERINSAHRKEQSQRKKKDKDDWTWRGKKELRTVEQRKNELRVKWEKKVRKVSGDIIWRAKNRSGGGLVAKSCPTLVTACSLSVGLSRQEYWSGLPFPSAGYLLSLRI